MFQLGSGTALPTCALLQQLLSRRPPQGRPVSTRVTLTDYNELVIWMATIPNILLACSTTDSPNNQQNQATDVEITTDVLTTIRGNLARTNTHVRAISGMWGSAFEDLCDFSETTSTSTSSRPRTIMLLASETIYSPASTETFTSTLLALMRKAITNANTRCVTYVAAKRFYFGVGGSIDHFSSTVHQGGGHVKTIWDSADTAARGVSRCILEISLK